MCVCDGESVSCGCIWAVQPSISLPWKALMLPFSLSFFFFLSLPCSLPWCRQRTCQRSENKPAGERRKWPRSLGSHCVQREDNVCGEARDESQRPVIFLFNRTPWVTSLAIYHRREFGSPRGHKTNIFSHLAPVLSLQIVVLLCAQVLRFLSPHRYIWNEFVALTAWRHLFTQSGSLWIIHRTHCFCKSYLELK